MKGLVKNENSKLFKKQESIEYLLILLFFIILIANKIDKIETSNDNVNNLFCCNYNYITYSYTNFKKNK